MPEDLRRIDALLSDPGLLAPIAARWQAEADVSGRSAAGHGRPTIAMETYVRLMVVRQRSGWGYETLVREVSDSLHLRRFCLIAIDRRVPDKSTVRKLARRLGAETVNEITRLVIAKAQRETRFVGRAVRVDSTVITASDGPASKAMTGSRPRPAGRSSPTTSTPTTTTPDPGAHHPRGPGPAAPGPGQNHPEFPAQHQPKGPADHPFIRGE